MKLNASFFKNFFVGSVGGGGLNVGCASGLDLALASILFVTTLFCFLEQIEINTRK